MTTDHHGRIGQIPRLVKTSVWISAAMFVLLVVLGAQGCFFSAISRDLVGPYNLLAVDDPEDLAICYSFKPGQAGGAGRIDATVVEVGWDTRYLVAARRRLAEPGSALLYYYIDMAKDHPGGISDGVVFGPYTKAEFDALKAEMELPEFTVHYPELR